MCTISFIDKRVGREEREKGESRGEEERTSSCEDIINTFKEEEHSEQTAIDG